MLENYRHEVLGVRLLPLLRYLPLTHLGRVSFVGFVFQDFCICISSQRFCVFAVLLFLFVFAFPPTMIGGLLPPALCPSSLSSMVAGSSGIVKLCKEDALETFKDLMLWMWMLCIFAKKTFNKVNFCLGQNINVILDSANTIVTPNFKIPSKTTF